MGEIKVDLDAYVLFEDLDFTMEKKPAMAGAIAPTYLLASPYIALNAHMDISIRLNDVKPGLRNKVLLVRWDPEKDAIYPEGGHYEDGWLIGASNYFGYFTAMVDTLPPTIASRDFNPNMKGRSSFSFTIKDELSDIDQIIPTIDGKWALMEYDPKTNRLTYYFDSAYITHGKHEFNLRVLDERKNESSYKGSFDW